MVERCTAYTRTRSFPTSSVATTATRWLAARHRTARQDQLLVVHDGPARQDGIAEVLLRHRMQYRRVVHVVHAQRRGRLGDRILVHLLQHHHIRSAQLRRRLQQLDGESGLLAVPHVERDDAQGIGCGFPDRGSGGGGDVWSGPRGLRLLLRRAGEPWSCRIGVVDAPGAGGERREDQQRTATMQSTHQWCKPSCRRLDGAGVDCRSCGVR